MINQKQSVLVIGIVIVSLLGMTMIPYASAAQDTQQNDTQQNNNQESVEVGIGQSLSIAIGTTSSDVEQQIEAVSRNRELGQASTPGEKSKVLSKDLNKTLRDARDVRTAYQDVVQDLKEGEISKSEFITRMSELSNRASKVQSNAESIEYATQFMDKENLSQVGVTNDKIAKVRDEVGIVGSEVARNISRRSIAGAKISLNANEKAIEATVKSNNGTVYEGREEERKSYKDFNITADEAIGIVEEEFGIDATEFEVEVEEDDDYDGYYKVEAENSTVEYEVVVDGNTGEIAEFEKEVEDEEAENEGRDENAGKNEGKSKGEDKGNRGQPNDKGENRSERGEKASSTQGSPPWAQYEEGEEDEEEQEEREEDEEDEEETNETEAEGELSVEIDKRAGSNVSILVTDGGEPASGVDILANGVVVGQTDSSGRLDVQVPEVPDVDVVAKDGDREAELEIEGEEDEETNETEEQEETNETEAEGELSVEIDEQTDSNATVLVTDDGDAVVDAKILVNDVLVGQTGAEGKLKIELPPVPGAEITAQDGEREAEIELGESEGEDTL